MKIIPPRTQPSTVPIGRRHRPAALADGQYRPFRSCLRWEFGFTCSFCLLHEADGRPDEPRYSTVEHLLGQASHPERINDYENCVLACAWCNSTRQAAPWATKDATLLDPTRHAWSDHFAVRENGLLEPVDDDPDARYTHTAYDLDDERKVLLRDFRKIVLDDHLDFLRKLGPAGVKLRATIDRLRAEGRIDEARELLDQEVITLRALVNVIRDLLRYRAVPISAPVSCRCKDKAVLEPPPELDSQCVDLREIVADLPLEMQAVVWAEFVTER